MTTNPMTKLVRRACALQRDDAGAAYSLSVVLILPILIAFILLSIELTLLFISQQSLNTATQTARHSAHAWLGHQDSLRREGDSLEKVVHHAIVRSLVPFASAKAGNEADAEKSIQPLIQGMGLSEVALKRFDRKQFSIDKATRVQVVPERRESDGWLLRVEYDVPLWTPFIAKLLKSSDDSAGRPVRTLVSESWLALSEFDIDRKGIGIPYSPHQSTVLPK